MSVDVGDEESAEQAATKCRRNGLLVSTQDRKILLLPALNIDRKVAERALDIFEESV